MSLVAPTLQLFFTERLAKQRQASPATIRSYRNAIVLLLRFVQVRTGKPPSLLDWEDLDAGTISSFLDHLEAERGNSSRSRNARLAALRSLFRFAALRHPEHAQLIALVLAIPQRRYDKKQVSFLEPEEVDALLTAPDRGKDGRPVSMNHVLRAALREARDNPDHVAAIERRIRAEREGQGQ